MRKIKVEMPNSPPDIAGTSLQGYLIATYADVVEVFGQPNAEGDSYKVDAEWCGLIDGQVFSLYNYKNGRNYCGADGMDVENITEWHIGGKSKAVEVLVHAYFANKKPEPSELLPVKENKSTITCPHCGGSLTVAFIREA